jgi:acyl carrier protein
MDSLTALDILTALEREFRVKLGEESMRKFTSIDGVSSVLLGVLGAS